MDKGRAQRVFDSKREKRTKVGSTMFLSRYMQNKQQARKRESSRGKVVMVNPANINPAQAGANSPESIAKEAANTLRPIAQTPMKAREGLLRT